LGRGLADAFFCGIFFRFAKDFVPRQLSTTHNDTNSLDDHSASARLLRSLVGLCIYSAMALFWVAVGVILISLLA
jgi:hypothetical protein